MMRGWARRSSVCLPRNGIQMFYCLLRAVFAVVALDNSALICGMMLAVFFV